MMPIRPAAVFHSDSLPPATPTGAPCTVARPPVASAGQASMAHRRPGGPGAPVVEDPEMMRLHQLIDRVAQAPVHVLVSGETGAGKEVVAELLHTRSPRSQAPFVRINCAAIPEALMESEFFGYERGAFTGAASGKPGLIEAAHQGTVLLDEIGELPRHLQAKLLRVTESNEVTRLGAIRARQVDVRFISATNRDLSRDVSAGTFRGDLFYRLNGMHLQVPPLRERRAEIPALASFFVRRAAERMGLDEPPAVTAAAMARLVAYPWPGNVRELRNVVERAVALRSAEGIGPWDLGLLAHPPPDERHPAPPSLAASVGGLDARRSGRAAIREGERERILHALQQCHYNQTRAADLLRMPRRTLVAKLTAYAIPRPRKGSPR